MSKHTPGPWAAGRSDMQTIVAGWPSKWVYGPDDSYLAAASGRNVGDWNEVMANAHLIAAAPDLLEALEAAHGWLVFVGTDHLEPVRARCRAAIAKAKGQSSSTDTARATE